MVGHKTRLFYLLSETDEIDENGHSALADELLLVVGKWTSELHDEVYIFDSGEWIKESSFWKAVKACHWIILSSIQQ